MFQDVQAHDQRLGSHKDNRASPHHPEATQLGDGGADGIIGHRVKEGNDSVEHADSGIDIVITPLLLGFHQQLEMLRDLQGVVHSDDAIADGTLALLHHDLVPNPGRHGVAGGAGELLGGVVGLVGPLSFAAALLALLGGLGHWHIRGSLSMSHEGDAEDVAKLLLLEARAEHSGLVQLSHGRDGQTHLASLERHGRALRPEGCVHRKPEGGSIEEHRHEDAAREEGTEPSGWSTTVHTNTSSAGEGSTNG
mmetsp:Transcript_57376/g.122001  ORF Transcript_57376/g.122001 Transcript_57376/m.122001 type:complete len:251 (+) Transcript_57376:2154-2906(+)